MDVKSFVRLPLVLSVLSACSGETLYKGAMGWERWRAGVSVAETVVDGHVMPYLEGGAGETVVMVHGFGVDKSTWLRFAAQLTGRYHVIAPDLPGFGDASRIEGAHYDLSTQAERLHTFLTALHIEKPHLIGNSMGGAISLTYALAHPTASLTLLNSAGVPTAEPSEVRRLIAQGQNPLVVSSIADLDRLMSLSFVVTPTIPTAVKEYFVQRGLKNRAFTEKIFAELNQPPRDFTSDLARVNTKTLVIFGDSDRIIHPSAGKIFADAIPGAKLVMMEKCGHDPALERPEETAQIWQGWFGSVRQEQIN